MEQFGGHLSTVFDLIEVVERFEHLSSVKEMHVFSDTFRFFPF